MGKRQRSESPIYWWRYSVRLENLGEKAVQLRERHWRIFALSGTLETIRGRGVVGLEPVLKPLSSPFQYSSHVSLQAPSGHMWSVEAMRPKRRLSFSKIFSVHLQGNFPDGARGRPYVQLSDPTIFTGKHFRFGAKSQIVATHISEFTSI